MRDQVVARLDGRSLGEFLLRVERLHALRRCGWWAFALALEDRTGRRSPEPVVDGVYSYGGKGVAAWVEMSYRTQVRLGSRRVGLRRRGLEGRLLAEIGSVVPAGGHIMVEYESPAHRETYAALARGIPPAVTPLGALLLEAGFVGGFKVWYFAEGGAEGPVKLQANRPWPAGKAAQERAARRAEIEEFLSATAGERADPLIAAARTRSRRLIARSLGA